MEPSNEWDWTKAYQTFHDPEEEVKSETNDLAKDASAVAAACSHDHSAERAIYDLSTEEKVARMGGHHMKGNALFEEGQYDRAYLQYKQALVVYEYTFPDDDEGWAELDALRLTVNVNAAAAANELGLWHDTLQQTYEALQKEPHNVKALYRRAQALRHLDDFGAARVALCGALRRRPRDFQLRDELATLNAQVAAYRARSRAMAGKMMRSGSGTSSGSDRQSGPAAAAAAAAAAQPNRPMPHPKNDRSRLLSSPSPTTTTTTTTSGSSAASPPTRAASATVDGTVGRVARRLDEPVGFDMAAAEGLVLAAAAAAAACVPAEASAAGVASLTQILRPATAAGPHQPPTSRHWLEEEEKKEEEKKDEEPPALGDSGTSRAVIGGASVFSSASSSSSSPGGQDPGPAASLASSFVFGDLNQPGAFVRPRRARNGTRTGGGHRGDGEPGCLSACCTPPPA